MKPALILLALATALFAQEKPAEKRELLSSHQTTATFSDIEKRKCRGRTSACPDRCGDSGDYASFKIIEYIDYKKPGKYGDPKQTTFSVQIQDNMENKKIIFFLAFCTPPPGSAAISAMYEFNMEKKKVKQISHFCNLTNTQKCGAKRDLLIQHLERGLFSY